MVRELTAKQRAMIRRQRISGHLSKMIQMYQLDGAHEIVVRTTTFAHAKETRYYLQCRCAWSCGSKVDQLELQPFMDKHKADVSRAFEVVPLILNLMGETL